MTTNETIPERITLADARSRATLTVEQAGQLLGLSRWASYQCVKRQEIPSIKLGHRIVVPTGALLRLLGQD